MNSDAEADANYCGLSASIFTLFLSWKTIIIRTTKSNDKVSAELLPQTFLSLVNSTVIHIFGKVTSAMLETGRLLVTIYND